ncbi:efflux RND transporter permease subunit [Hahella ganghwensis]|uniref:efflux RND transporter permease subunit n=1 Tax=Hahella ganghwensis TaxID=286420 RepID=UPI0003700944|nr:MMPL family transporter [Hahella ganghwensis]
MKNGGLYQALNKYRYWMFGLMLAITLGLSWGVGKIQYSMDYRIFFPPEDPSVLALDELHQQFWKSDTLLFVIHQPDGEIFNRKDLTAIHELTEESWYIPHAYRVDSITNYQHIEAEGDVINVDALMRDPARDLTDENILHIRRVVLNEIDLVNQLVSEDASTVGVLVTLQVPADNPFGGMEATFRAREMLSQFQELNPNLTAKLTGLAAVETTYPEVSQQDMETLTPAMYLIILVVTAFMFRRIGAVIVVLATVSLATFSAMGFSGWLGYEATALTGLLPTIVLVIAVADIVHIMAATRNLTGNYESRFETVVEAIRKTFKPVTITSLTTAVGFLSLSFAASPPYQEFGILAAVGAILAYVVTLALAPVLLPLLRFKPSQNGRTTVFGRTVLSLVSHPYRWFALVLLLFVPLLIPASNNQINDRIVENFDESIPVRSATEFAFDKLTGIYRLEYVAKATESDIANPQYLQELDQFASWLRTQPEISSVSVLTDTIKKLNRALHGDDQSYYRLPDDAGMAAQMLLVYEMSLPYGMDLSNQVNIEKSASRIVVTLHKLDTVQIRAVKARADEWWQENANTAVILPDAGTGETIIFANLTHISIEYMVYGVAFALVLITGLIMVFLRSIPLGVLSFFPNVVPFVLLFGIWGLIKGEINTAAANVCVILYGLIVDATIHLINEFKVQKEQHGLSTKEAVMEAYRNVLPAISANTVILAVGFTVFTLSPFTMNADLGLMGAIGIVSGFVVDLLMLPVLLVLFENLREKLAERGDVALQHP